MSRGEGERRYYASPGGAQPARAFRVVEDGRVRFEPAPEPEGEEVASETSDEALTEAGVRVLPGGDRIMVSLDGRSAVGFAERRDGLWHVELEGRTYRVRVDDERTHRIRELTAEMAPEGGEVELRAPMPGLVVRITVAPGDEVRAGDGLVVMEAMKMENELKAERDGVVEAVHVEEGRTVDRDDLLVTFEAGLEST